MGKIAYIGEQIHKLRKDKNLTLTQLANKVGVSASYLSQVENEKTSPSIATLMRIAEALEVRTVDFFAGELIEDPPILPPEAWTRITLPGWNAELSQLVHVVGNKRMQPFHTVVQPGGGTYENYSHPGEEFGFVIEGTLTLELGGETHLLEAGTAVYFPSLVPHCWRNEGAKPCRLIWVVSPPSW